ncbi:MAG: DUF2298 domain-containing protein [Thermomicrobiales bacterium]
MTRRIHQALARLQPTLIALVVVLLAALTLRVYQLDWDEGHYLHPDERFIADVISNRISLDWPPDFDNLLDPSVSHLNPRSDDPESGRPRNFAYGALPLFVTEAVAEVMSAVSGEEWTRYGQVYKVGRALSALFDTATVLIIFLIASHVFNRRTGLVAAAVAALVPMSIQLAHFFTTDSWLTFFVALTLLFSIRAAERGNARWFVAAGASFGLAMATKGSVFTLAGVIAVAVALDAYRRWRDGTTVEGAVKRAPVFLIASGLAAIAAFALFEPYALARPIVYIEQLQEQSEVIRGVRDYPYTRQYVGTTPVVYQIEQVVRWGLGPVAGVLALLGIVVLTRRCSRTRALGQAVLLAWFFGYGIVIALVETKFLRYEAPLVPVLAVAAAVAFDAVRSWLRQRGRPRLAASVCAALLVGMALWTAAFTSIYAADNPRIAASKWIYANVPPGSTLSAESWDDPLPMGLAPGLNSGDFQFSTLWFDMYGDRPPEEVAAYLYGNLEQLDYVILASNRVSSAMPQAPWRYAVQERYYELLNSGELGFELVADFHRYPSIGEWNVPDFSADESFINYDHPRVLIFQKKSLAPRATYDHLMSWAVSQPHSPTRYPPDKTLLLDEPVGELTVIDDARWSARFTENSLAAVAVWIVLLATLQIAGWPLISLLLGRFADGGWGFARLATLLVAGYLVWLGASLEFIAFRAVWAVVAIGILALGWLMRWRLRRWHDWSSSPAQRRTAFATEGVFWSIFSLFLLFRYLNPDSWHPFWGGEKPMEFAHINAMLRSAHFPPYDPWFSDGYINYYYYGLYLVAFCIKLTGIPSEIAFNLAQPTMMALLGSGVFSLTATLGRDATRRRRMAIPAGILGVVLTLLIGNLDSFVRVVRAFPEPITPSFDWTWNATRVIDPPWNTITEFPYFTGLYADLHAHVVALPITVLAIALAYAIARDPRLFAVAIHRRGTTQARTVLLARTCALSLCLGTVSATNAWDVPIYLALVAVAVFMAASMISSLAARLVVASASAIAIGIIGYGLFLPFFQHYVALFSSLGSVRTKSSFWEFGDHLGGLLTVVALGLVVVSLDVTRAHRPNMPHPGIPIAGVALLLCLRLVIVDANDALADALTSVLVIVVTIILAAAAWNGASGSRHSTFVLLARLACLLAFAGAIIAIATGRPVLATGLAFAGAGAALWLTSPRRSVAFTAAMVAAAGCIIAGTELVYVVDDLSGGTAYRMNTVFKFYNQVWMLLALSGAILGAIMLERVWNNRPWSVLRSQAGTSDAVGLIARLTPESLRAARGVDESKEVDRKAALVTQWAIAGTVLTIVVISTSLFYPLLATRPRLEQRFTPDLGSGTLNALDWMDYGTITNARGDVIAFDGDRAVIDWFNDHVEGSPIVAEASLPPYRGNGSRISIGTGLPTILGWDRHQYQQRYSDGIAERSGDVRQLYDSPDPLVKQQLLRKYNVGYVVVGDVERLSIINESTSYASPEGIAAFETMVGTVLEVVFEAEGTIVYRVHPPVEG